MPKKNKSDLIVTHIFADGRVMTDEEFMSKPFVVEYEKNKELYEEAARMFDPLYYEREREKRRRELIEKRKERLEEEARNIQEQLDSLI